MSKPATIVITRKPTSRHQIEEAFRIIDTPSVTNHYILNVNISLYYIANGKPDAYKIIDSNVTADDIGLYEAAAKRNFNYFSPCTIEVVFELIPSSLNITRCIRNEEELTNVIQAMKQYVKNGHSVEIQHTYSSRNGDGATEKRKIPSYQLQKSGLASMQKRAIINNLKEIDCFLTMDMCIKFS